MSDIFIRRRAFLISTIIIITVQYLSCVIFFYSPHHCGVSPNISFSRAVSRRCRQFAPCVFEMWPSTLFHNVFYFTRKQKASSWARCEYFFSLSQINLNFIKFFIWKNAKRDDMAITAVGMHFLHFTRPWRVSLTGCAAFQQPNSTTLFAL